MNRILFITFIFFIIIYSITNTKEYFTDSTTIPLTRDNIADYIYKIYKSDVKSIQNLTDIAMKLQLGGINTSNITILKDLTVNNTTNLTGTLTVDGSTNISNNLTVKNNLAVNSNAQFNNSMKLTNGATINGKYTDTTNNDLNTDLTYKNYINIVGTLILKQQNGKYTYFNLKDGTNSINCNTTFTKEIASPTIDEINLNLIKLTDNNTRLTSYVNERIIMTLCDKRIKENIKMANSCEILNKINNLQLSNYNYIYNNYIDNNYIDKKFYNGDTVYGLIAQDVMKVFPEAVNLSTQYIPNINKFAKIEQINNNVKLILNYNIVINKNDNIKLLINYNEVIVNVIEYNQNYIIVNKWDNYNDLDNVYVYGSEIDDFHSLDPAYLGILSWGGIQELTKQFNELNKNNKELIDINFKLHITHKDLLNKLNNFLINNNV